MTSRLIPNILLATALVCALSANAQKKVYIPEDLRSQYSSMWIKVKLHE